MFVLWKKTEFYKEESNREKIVIAAGGLGEDAEECPSNFFHFPWKSYFPPIVTWNGTQNELILKGTLRIFSACGAYFCENLQFKNF